MKKLLLLVALGCASLFSFSQDVVNQTDAKGLKQGRWMGRYPGGTLKYEGAFVDNKPVGAWKRYHENGRIKAEISYRAHSERALTSLFDDEGKLYAKGVFEGTLRDSLWNFYSGNQVVQRENYRLGKREGVSAGFDQNGRLIWEKEWKNDLPEGRSVVYYPTGSKKSELTYQAGKKSGVARFWEENGTVSMEGAYVDDLSDGDWKVYDREGKLKYVVKYGKGAILNSAMLDSLQLLEFKRNEQNRGKITEPKQNESGLPDNQ